jgi:hypothetical protein
MGLIKLQLWLRRLVTSFGKLLVSIILPQEVVLPPKLLAKKGVVPVELGELMIDDPYLHVAVTPDTYELSVGEFLPIGRPRKSRHEYMPNLEELRVYYPTTQKMSFVPTEPLGLVPERRENFHRVFLATDEARDVILCLVQKNDLRGYFSLIRDTLSLCEAMLINENDIFAKAAFAQYIRGNTAVSEPTAHPKKVGKEMPPAPPPQ